MRIPRHVIRDRDIDRSFQPSGRWVMLWWLSAVMLISVGCHGQVAPDDRQSDLDALCAPREVGPSAARELDHIDIEVAFAALERDDDGCHQMASTFIGVNGSPRLVVAELEALRARVRRATRDNRANVEVAQRFLLVISSAYNQRFEAPGADAAALRATVTAAADSRWWVDVTSTPFQRSLALGLSSEAVIALSTLPLAFAIERLESLAASEGLDAGLRPSVEVAIRRWHAWHPQGAE